MKNLLIISNNVLSNTNNNGKTIWSFFGNIDNLSIYQLYLSGEVATIEGANYYRITDKDIMKGLFKSSYRGNVVLPIYDSHEKDDYSIKKMVGRNDFTLVARDILWLGNWKSKKLLRWVDEIQPDAIFFVAGDFLVAYDICEMIQQRTGARLTVYMTDDYIMPRSRENILHMIRRRAIRKRLSGILDKASCFYTISDIMQKAYLRELGAESFLAVNMSEDLKMDGNDTHNCTITLMYAGSFYFGRADTLGILAKAIKEINEKQMYPKMQLMLYSNFEPEDNVKNMICVDGASEYGGSLSRHELREKLNEADILVFVESFDKVQVEKTKYSLSTKVTEYMSVEKPILAIGPNGIGSMNYLQDISVCVNDISELKDRLEELISDRHIMDEVAKKSREKYLVYHNKEKLKNEMAKNVLGTENIG